MQLGEGHTAGERWSQDTTPGSPRPEEHVCGTTLQCGRRGAGSIHRGHEATAESECFKNIP